jgi:hypothetical protein
MRFSSLLGQFLRCPTGGRTTSTIGAAKAATSAMVKNTAPAEPLWLIAITMGHELEA